MDDNENILRELWHKFEHPWHENSFVLYFIFVIIILGGAGIWLPFLENKPVFIEDIITNIVTYSCALIAPSVVSIILSIIKVKNKVSLALVILAMLGIVLFSVGYTVCAKSIITAVLSAMISLISWVIANTDNVELSDSKFNESIKEGADKLKNNW